MMIWPWNDLDADADEKEEEEVLLPCQFCEFPCPPSQLRYHEMRCPSLVAEDQQPPNRLANQIADEPLDPMSEPFPLFPSETRRQGSQNR